MELPLEFPDGSTVVASRICVHGGSEGVTRCSNQVLPQLCSKPEFEYACRLNSAQHSRKAEERTHAGQQHIYCGT